MNINVTSEEKRESVKRDYNIIAEEYSAEFGKKYEDIEVINKFLSKMKEHSKILDLGGGTGKLTDLFIKRGHNSICYDFSEEMMRKSREYYPNLPYILDDILNMEKYFDRDTFDGIIAFYSLFHIPRENIDYVFSNIRDLLKENGIFCFVVQLGDGEKFIDEPYLKEKGKNILYVNFFTHEIINKLLSENSFEKIFEIEKREIGENELGENGNNKLFIIAKKI